MLIGGAGTDVLDGGPGGNVVIDALAAAANDVSSAKVVSKKWVRAHTRIKRGATVLKFRGEKRTLPSAERSALVRSVIAS